MRRIRSGAAGDAFFERAYLVVRAIPRGHVATYGGVAAALGRPLAARAVGWALRALSVQRGNEVPWHRVVAQGGRVSLPGVAGLLQRRKLRAEGVGFRLRRVDMKKHAVLPGGREGQRGSAEGRRGGGHPPSSEVGVVRPPGLGSGGRTRARTV
jgi:methylated-DNA-protein-cysteine methyltransferase related protein